jgi:hypothetical protein
MFLPVFPIGNGAVDNLIDKIKEGTNAPSFLIQMQM